LTDRILPDVFELSQNFPNPFNPNTQIQFALGKDELVNLNIFDIHGRLVSSLINNSNYPAGYHNITCVPMVFAPSQVMLWYPAG
jgi:hypothetical protein